MQTETISAYPIFKQFVDGVYSKSPMQRKYLSLHFAKRDELFWKRAETFSKKFTGYLDKIGMTLDQAVDAYLEVCKDMLTSQMNFRKTQKYSCPNAAEARANVYSSDQKMTGYMVGLILSQFLWPNHYEMYDFFLEQSKKLGNVKKILEIGPGHGLFLAESISLFPKAQFEAIDISPTSKKLSEGLTAHFTGKICTVQNKDIAGFQGGGYDYIVMGEVLEHLDDPVAALKKIHRFLNKDGHFLMTTCANAPAIDHVYLYESIEHIQDHIRQSGFAVVAELALPVEDVPKEQWKEKKIEVNYTAMLKKI